MKKYIYLLALPLLLVACSEQETQIHVTTPPANTGVASEYSEAFLTANTAQLLFKEDQSIAYFTGIGNEYASFTETTRWLSNQYVEVTIDNGGTILTRYFYVDQQAIYLVKELTEEENALTLEQLVTLPHGKQLLTVPLQIGMQMEDWYVTKMDATVTTPLQTFTNVTIFEKHALNETNILYVAPGFGVVKNEFIATFDGKEEVISSTLTSIEYE